MKYSKFLFLVFISVMTALSGGMGCSGGANNGSGAGTSTTTEAAPIGPGSSSTTPTNPANTAPTTPTTSSPSPISNSSTPDGLENLTPPNGGLNAVNGNNTSASNPIIAIAPDNQPVIAWFEYDAGAIGSQPPRKIYVAHRNGDTWTRYGNAISGPSGIVEDRSLNLVLLPNGNPIVSWIEYESNDAGVASNVYVRAWDGTAWQSLGDGVLNAYPNTTIPTPAIHAQMKLGLNDQPLIIWRELRTDSSMYDIVVSQWNGTNWKGVQNSNLSFDVLGNSSIFDVLYNGPSLCTSKYRPDSIESIRLTAIWPSNDGIQVRYWNNTQWSIFDSSALHVTSTSTSYRYTNCSLVNTSLLRPYVGWWEYNSSPTSVSTLYVNVWMDRAWQAVGPDAGKVIEVNSGMVSYPVLASATPDLVYMTWLQSDGIHLTKGGGSNPWTNIVSPFRNSEDSTVLGDIGLSEPYIAYDYSNQNLFLAWSEWSNATNSHEIYVRRFHE